MKYILLLFTTLIGTKSYAQIFDTKKYDINNFGQIIIPNQLDTLAQDLALKYIKETANETYDKKNNKFIEKYFNIDIKKNIIEKLDSATTLFWPKKTLLLLIRNGLNYNSDSLLNEDFNLMPNISLKRVASGFKSRELKLYLSNKIKLEEYSDLIKNAHIGVIKSIYPNVKIEDIKVKYSLYKTTYPQFAISTNYINSYESNTKSYTTDIFTIFKEDFQYLIKFEYLNDEKIFWQSFELTFLSNMNLK